MAHAQKVHYAEERSPINIYDDSQDVKMTKALLTKSAQWSYEAEWRLCEYERGPCVVKFRPENLTGIIIGALAAHSIVEMIKGWVAERSLPVRLSRASISNKAFALDIIPL